MATEIRSDVVDEGRRILDGAAEQGVVVRLIGGVAIRVHAPGELPPALVRSYGDIDLVAGRKGGRDVERLLVGLGYEANDRFNAMNAGRRMVFYDNHHGRQLDVFLGEFEMCHKLDLGARLDVDPQTVPLAELLLTKLQIVQLNAKDATDVVTLVSTHDVADHDDDAINEEVVAKLLAADWGLWRTVRDTIEKTREHVGTLDLPADVIARTDDRLQRIWLRAEDEPKGFRWRQRARVGDRARWYQEPEEIAHAPLGPEA